jgi:hypothetical protein
VDKEAELDEKEVELIRQVNVKEVNKQQFRELVGELDLERAMEESMAKGPPTMQATTQDEDVGESKWYGSVGEEEPEAAEAMIAAEALTIGKGKHKVAPAKTKVFSKVDGPVSHSAEVHHFAS